MGVVYCVIGPCCAVLRHYGVICTCTKIGLEKLQLELDWNYWDQHLVIQKNTFSLLCIKTLKKRYYILYIYHAADVSFSLKEKTAPHEKELPVFHCFCNTNVKIKKILMLGINLLSHKLVLLMSFPCDRSKFFCFQYFEKWMNKNLLIIINSTSF